MEERLRLRPLGDVSRIFSVILVLVHEDGTKGVLRHVVLVEEPGRLQCVAHDHLEVLALQLVKDLRKKYREGVLLVFVEQLIDDSFNHVC